MTHGLNTHTQAAPAPAAIVDSLLAGLSGKTQQVLTEQFIKTPFYDNKPRGDGYPPADMSVDAAAPAMQRENKNALCV